MNRQSTSGSKLCVIGVLVTSHGVCLASATLEQQIDPPAIHLGDTAKISITVKDGGWTRLLQLPKVADVTIIRLGREQINGTAEHLSVTSRFSVLPSHTGEVTIPGFDVKTQDAEVLHVQPMTLQVFDPGQNIPQEYLQQSSRVTPTVTPTPANSTSDTLTVLSGTSLQPAREIHYGPDGKADYTVDLTHTNSQSVTDGSQVGQSRLPANTGSDSAQPRVFASRPTLAAIDYTQTGSRPPPTQNEGLGQINYLRAYGTVLQRADDGYLVSVALFGRQWLLSNPIVMGAYINAGVVNPGVVGAREYWVPCDNPTLADDDRFDKIVVPTADTRSYTTVLGDQRTVHVLSLLDPAEAEQVRAQAAIEEKTREEEAPTVCWAINSHGWANEFLLPHRLAVALGSLHGLTGSITVEMIQRVQSGDATAINSIAGALDEADRQVLLNALRTAKFE